MKIIKSTFPADTILLSQKTVYDYSDSYEIAFLSPRKEIKSTSLATAFFSGDPNWIQYLFLLRNKIVALFGLKTGDSLANREKQLKNFKYHPGECLGIFKILYKNDQEIIIGEEDKHLDFKVSLHITPSLNQQQKFTLQITTIVKYHNTMGRIYFTCIAPFHKAIVKSILKSMVRQLEH